MAEAPRCGIEEVVSPGRGLPPVLLLPPVPSHGGAPSLPKCIGDEDSKCNLGILTLYDLGTQCPELVGNSYPRFGGATRRCFFFSLRTKNRWGGAGDPSPEQ